MLSAGLGAAVDFLRTAKLPAVVTDGLTLFLSSLQVAVLERKTPPADVYSRVKVGDTCRLGTHALPSASLPSPTRPISPSPVAETDLLRHRAVCRVCGEQTPSMELMRACVEASLAAVANDMLDLSTGDYRVLWDASDVGGQVGRHMYMYVYICIYMDSARPGCVRIHVPSTSSCT